MATRPDSVDYTDKDFDALRDAMSKRRLAAVLVATYWQKGTAKARP
ncbi:MULTISPECIES: hypothetical protein [Myxococcus]|nr:MULTISPECIES: hypothetical protein [Myxococcus]NOJ54083.1 hypothetical protein [Myxococcus xanthus]QPM82001.1 hypothetical protein I5Q59_12320 [Myxococcus xanthus]QVW71250.1 hypothetical protein JTM82_17675 [Myxococcus xanthus DZ2]QZZ50212.1 hypothetical protein MyxoNM_13460 [Myxococcus xanthus]UEO02620.1 hypothetical protein K1515_25130 [Myxococcus xanthus DZ2]